MQSKATRPNTPLSNREYGLIHNDVMGTVSEWFRKDSEQAIPLLRVATTGDLPGAYLARNQNGMMSFLKDEHELNGRTIQLCESYVRCQWLRVERDLLALQRENEGCVMMQIPRGKLRSIVWEGGTPEGQRLQIYGCLCRVDEHRLRVTSRLDYYSTLYKRAKLEAKADRGPGSGYSDEIQELLRPLENAKYRNITMLRRVVFAYSNHTAELGNLQGVVNAASWLCAGASPVPNEEDVFWLLDALCNKLLPGTFVKSVQGVVRDVTTFRDVLVPRLLPDLHEHCENLSVGFPTRLASMCLLSLFVDFASPAITWRIFDLIFAEGADIMMHILMVFFRQSLSSLLAANSIEEMELAFRRSVQTWYDTHDFDRCIRQELLGLPLSWRLSQSSQSPGMRAGAQSATDTKSMCSSEDDATDTDSKLTLDSLGTDTSDSKASLMNLHVILVEGRGLVGSEAPDSAALNRNGQNGASSDSGNTGTGTRGVAGSDHSGANKTGGGGIRTAMKRPYCVMQFGNVSKQSPPCETYMQHMHGRRRQRDQALWNWPCCFTTFAEALRC